MKNNILLITPENLKDYTPTDGNVDDKLITPFIINAQQIDLQTALGTNFYNQLINTVEDTTITQVNRDFIEGYIQQFLIQKAYYYLLPNINIKSTNLGLLKSAGENSESALIEEVKMLREQVLNLSEFYLERIQKELVNNKDLYPVYTNDDTQNVEPNLNSYFNTMYIPNKNKNNC